LSLYNNIHVRRSLRVQSVVFLKTPRHEDLPSHLRCDDSTHHSPSPQPHAPILHLQTHIHGV
jgi:hypothetical protein